MAQKKLGDAYANLTAGEQTDNSKWAILYYKDDIITYIEQTEDKAQAITCCHNLLRIFTEQDFPKDYAWAQNYLGDVYRDLPIGDRSKNFQQAITCYKNAIRIYTAQTENQVENLRQAINCCNNMLCICIEQEFPKDYDWVQDKLRFAHANLPGDDQQGNLLTEKFLIVNCKEFQNSKYIIQESIKIWCCF